MNRIIFILFCCTFFSSCEEEGYGIGYVVTKEITDIIGSTAIGHGEVEIDYTGNTPPNIWGKGIIYSTDKSALQIASHTYHSEGFYDNKYGLFRYFSYRPISSNASISDIGYEQYDGWAEFHIIGGIGTYDCLLFGLQYNTKYYVRAFAHITDGVNDTEKQTYVYGEIREFTSGNDTKDPSVFIPINELKIGVLKEDLPGLYSVTNVQSINTFSTSYYSFGGYSNWRIPTLNELQEIYKLQEVIGGFKREKYWSSTNKNGMYFSLVDFANGNYGYVGSDDIPMSTSANIRLVRNLP